MAVTATTLRLVSQMRGQLEAVTDAQTRDLVRAWVTAWDEVQGELHDSLLELIGDAKDGRVTRTQAMKSIRLRNALTEIGDHLDTLAAQAGVRISADLDAVIRQAGQLQDDLIGSQLPPSEIQTVQTWSRVSGDQIDAMVTRSTQQITSSLKPLSADATKVMRRELIRGVAVGANPRETASRIVRRTEGRFNGGLSRALTISRTEMLDAHRQAALVSRMQNADVLGGWVWTASMSERTCPACWSRHGTVYPVDATGPDDHPNGRCTAVPKTKTWAELGFDIEEPPSLLPDADATFRQLSVGEQRTILGPGRYDAWKAGDFPMSDWGRVRHNDGWRDSWQVAPVPQSLIRAS